MYWRLTHLKAIDLSMFPTKKKTLTLSALNITVRDIQGNNRCCKSILPGNMIGYVDFFHLKTFGGNIDTIEFLFPDISLCIGNWIRLSPIMKMMKGFFQSGCKLTIFKNNVICSKKKIKCSTNVILSYNNSR